MIYLGLGANDGNRKENLERAIGELVAAGFRLNKVSPVVESPALLPPDADPAWHKPYLNLVVAGDADWSPADGIKVAKRIEKKLGRGDGARWSPRTIDIDILLWHDLVVGGGGDDGGAGHGDDGNDGDGDGADGDGDGADGNGDGANGDDGDADGNSGNLTIPHADARRRDFVLTPLLHLRPDLAVGGDSVFDLTKTIRPIPLWMAIVNLTPDSFSDGGSFRDDADLDRHLAKLVERGVHILDLGAESTRPGAAAVDPADEWSRLEPALANLAERIGGKHVKPWLSVDSYHPPTIEKSLRYGVGVVNDVTGLTDPNMIALVKQNDLQAIAMHSVTVPASTARLTDDTDAVAQLLNWLHDKIETWSAAGLDLNRIIFDPGVGFGKSSVQTFNLLSRCADLRAAGLRLAVGHSRKSFLAAVTDRAAAARDLETLGVSLALAEQGADIIRVHAPFIHQRAYLAWAHINAAR